MDSDQELCRWAAERLLAAQASRTPIPPLTERYPELTGRQAYGIQKEIVARWTAAGARVVGKKIGLTSKAAQNHFGVFEPDYGHLTDTMSRPEDSVVDINELIQPKIEGEIAFVLSRDLSGSVTAHEVLRAIDFALPVLEICDTRIEGWKLRAPDLVADNTCSAMFVTGGVRRRVDDLDLRRLGMVLERNGEVIDTGASVAVMGNPINAVAHLVRKLADVGSGLAAGELVLSGAIGTMIPVAPGDRYTLRIEGLGTTRIAFSGRRS